jgi:hypothetical protein
MSRTLAALAFSLLAAHAQSVMCTAYDPAFIPATSAGSAYVYLTWENGTPGMDPVISVQQPDGSFAVTAYSASPFLAICSKLCYVDCSSVIAAPFVVVSTMQIGVVEYRTELAAVTAVTIPASSPLPATPVNVLQGVVK